MCPRSSSQTGAAGGRVGVEAPVRHTGEVTTAVDTDRLLAAEAVAREALLADGHHPGDHLAAKPAGDWAVVHYFNADLPGYQGWQWCVVLAGSPGGETPTVSEVVLLPGDGALLAPAWVPWAERISGGDLGPGDMLAAEADDPRLVPGQIDTEDEYLADPDEVGQVFGEIGLGRRRLLSREGRDEAAQRWYDGDYGPDSEMARVSRYNCATCGFYLPLAGALHVAFGACANEYAADGHVVSAEYGCGAHSDVRAPKVDRGPAYEPYDDGAVEFVELPAVPTEKAVAEQPDEAVTEENADGAAPVAETAKDETAEAQPAETAPEAADTDGSATDPQS